MTSKQKRCKQCDKFCYGKDAAFHAALGTARTTGKPTRIYRCPYDRQVFHLTTKKAGNGRG